MIATYRIRNYGEGKNSHGIGIRSEYWKLEKDALFDTEKAAKEYVVAMNRKHSDLPLLLVDLPEKDRQKFAEDFSFGNEYWSMRRFFLGKPDLSLIKADLKKRGIEPV